MVRAGHHSHIFARSNCGRRGTLRLLNGSQIVRATRVVTFADIHPFLPLHINELDFEDISFFINISLTPVEARRPAQEGCMFDKGLDRMCQGYSEALYGHGRR
jgi:hypothetical protein